MKSIFRIAALVSLLFCCLYLHATATVSGTIKDPSGAVVPNSFVRFELANTNNGQCSAGGSSLGKRTVDFNADLTTGAVSGTLYRNDTEVSCAGSFNSRYNMTIYRKGVPDGPSKCVNVTASFDISAPQFCSTPPPVANPAQYVTAGGNNSFTGTNITNGLWTFGGETHIAKGLFYDVKAYGNTTTCNGTQDDTPAFSAAFAAACVNSSSDLINVVRGQGNCRIHELDESACSGAYLEASHPGELLLTYNGVGSAGSYLLKLGSLSFGGVRGVRFSGYNADGAAIAESGLIVGPGTWDAMGEFDNNQFFYFSGNAVRVTGLFTNLWMRGNRWDVVLGYPIELNSNNTGNGNPVHIQDWTYDNHMLPGAFSTLAQALGKYDGAHSGLGFIFCNLCGGAKFDISNGRGEHNTPLRMVGNADNGSILYEQGATSTVTAILDNDVIQGNSASQVAAVSAATTKVNVEAHKTDLTTANLGVLKNRATNTIIGSRFDGMGAVFSAGVNPQQSRGIQIEDQRIENLANAFIATNVQRWNCGDWNMRPSGDFTATNGPIRIVTGPCPGYSFSTAISLSTTATITSGSPTVSNIDPQALNIRVNDNLIVNSVAVLVTAVDYIAKTITMNSNAGASLTGSATVTRAVAVFTDYGMDATRASSLPGGSCTSGQVRWNSNPASGQPIGWFCGSSAWAAGPTVPSAGVSANSIYSGICTGTATSSTTLSFDGLGATPSSGAKPCTAGVAAAAKPVVPSAGTVSNLYVACATGGFSASSGVFTIFDNGSTTGVTCTVGTGTTCNDTTHTGSIAAGDRLDLRFTTQGTETLANCVVSFQKN